MSDYIKRDSLIEDMVQKHCEDCERRKNADGKTVYALGDAPCRACELGDLIDEVEDYPAADVRENVHGKWIVENLTERFIICSICSEVYKRRGLFNFCPNCGADMREVKTDE